MSNQFPLFEDDFYAIETAKKIARLFLTLNQIKPEQIIGLGKALYALERLPQATSGIWIEYGVELRKGNDSFRESSYVDFIIQEDRFEISRGGSIYDNQTGGDSYSLPGWVIETGGYYIRECELGYIENEVIELIDLGGNITVTDDSDA